MAAIKLSETTIQRFRNYVVDEPSYTVKFAAWELKLSTTAIAAANKEMLRLGIVHQIEERSGIYAAVYAYRPIPGDRHSPRRRRDGTNNTPLRAVKPVAGTGKPTGPSGKPGRKPRPGRRPK